MNANSTDNLPIYQNGITLSPQEVQVLTEKAWSQSRQIAWIMRGRYPSGFTYQEMRVLLESLYGEKKINQDSVKRAMTTMTGSEGAPKKMQDKYGRYPLVKLPDKRLNPETSKHIHVYAWNHRFKKLPTNQELLARQKNKGQMNFHQDLFNQVEQ